MHRFYMQQSFTKFQRNAIAPAALFLAAKVEEQPRKLEHVIKVAHACLKPQEPSPDTKSEAYLQQAQDLVILESIILQTLGFEITIDHPHTHVVKCTQLVRASKDLAQTSYFMATNSLHLTTFCLQYQPPIVACVCIHLACKWSNWEIPVSTDGKHWWEYVDSTVTLELLDELTHEFLQILEKTPNRLKRIKNWRACQAAKKPKGDGQGGGEESGGGLSISSSENALSELMSIATSSAGMASFHSLYPSAMQSHCAEGSGSDPQQWSTQPHGELQLDLGPPSHKPLELIPSGKQDLLMLDNHGLPDGVYHPQGEGTGAYGGGRHEQKNGGGKFLPPPLASSAVRVSLNEYRAKHAEELAAQKRKLENLEANVREHYASAAQALIKQQLHDRHPQPTKPQDSSPIPIRIKIPLANSDKHIKLRLPVTGGERAPGEEKLKVRIKVPSDLHSSSDEGSSKSRHPSPHSAKEHSHRDPAPSNHHHHHHHHHHHRHSHSSGGSSRRSGSKHGTPASGVPALSSNHSSSSSSSRKRQHGDESSHNHQPKASKASKPSSGALPFQPHFNPSILDLPFPPSAPSLQQGGYGRTDKDALDAHGQSAGPSDHQHNSEYQDTFDMLESLLSAQGMQPVPQPRFDFLQPYSDFRYPGGMSGAPSLPSTDITRPPPLPAEPPPPLPPLPK
uniref:Cyclin T1 n=2 Tax=Callorhinchus milii TaxID=7868 RepID=A0A4W3GHJ0_CALMI|eukprot:gi/632988117/ref/XP_007882931.1/ PREDICTED: cyclin-T1 [Callorhinchus milii]